jgi:hypothetical protein
MIRKVFGAPLWAESPYIVILRAVIFFGSQEQSFEQQAGDAKTALHATAAVSWDMRLLILPVDCNGARPRDCFHWANYCKTTLFLVEPSAFGTPACLDFP